MPQTQHCSALYWRIWALLCFLYLYFIYGFSIIDSAISSIKHPHSPIYINYINGFQKERVDRGDYKSHLQKEPPWVRGIKQQKDLEMDVLFHWIGVLNRAVNKNQMRISRRQIQNHHTQNKTFVVCYFLPTDLFFFNFVGKTAHYPPKNLKILSNPWSASQLNSYRLSQSALWMKKSEHVQLETKQRS